jgi:hypothetical protein
MRRRSNPMAAVAILWAGFLFLWPLVLSAHTVCDSPVDATPATSMEFTSALPTHSPRRESPRPCPLPSFESTPAVLGYDYEVHYDFPLSPRRGGRELLRFIQVNRP